MGEVIESKLFILSSKLFILLLTSSNAVSSFFAPDVPDTIILFADNTSVASCFVVIELDTILSASIVPVAICAPLIKVRSFSEHHSPIALPPVSFIGSEYVADLSPSYLVSSRVQSVFGYLLALFQYSVSKVSKATPAHQTFTFEAAVRAPSIVVLPLLSKSTQSPVESLSFLK